jgi:AraC-like DNA-binding protein
MMNFLYLAFRGGSGFALIVVGLALLMGTSRTRVSLSLGVLFSSVGALFTISALDPVLPLPVEIGNLVVIALVYAVSQALFELTLTLFGDARVEKHRARVAWVGAALSLTVWIVPLFDAVLPSALGGTSVEDGHSQGPLHTFVAPVIYLWPLVVTVLSIQMGRWRLRDLSFRSPKLRGLVLGMTLLVAIFLVLVASVAFEWEAAYRLAQTVLQLLMLGWYFAFSRDPNLWERFRSEVGRQHETNQTAQASGHAEIAKRLAKLQAEGNVLWDPDLNLGRLASRVGVPAYLLSSYFNVHLSTTFSAWLNDVRIRRVCRLMADAPGAKILDLAFAAGYNSKSTFNLQFSKLMGTSPSDFRASQNPQLTK